MRSLDLKCLTSTLKPKPPLFGFSKSCLEYYLFLNLKSYKGFPLLFLTFLVFNAV